MPALDAAPFDPELSALDADGHADLGPVLSGAECDALAGMFAREAPFRSHIVMRRHGFGEGEYKYFADPLPEPVARLRATLYARLLPLARDWAARLGLPAPWPDDHAAYRALCAAAGQGRPTPLLLRYRAGDYNRLHQDLYGPLAFPIQAVILLSDPAGFEGGEFVLTEQRPRMQTRATVAPLRRGHALAFAVNDRPVQGTRGTYRAKQRHGVSRLTAGERFTLGIIFHDAA
ncbi:MAG: 2OG-Fe(II) oxygenase [Pseudomonadota bacterium]|nr:2OG-Fe(II) oxygenase [Pseudomonadota bacterium]